MSSMLRSFPTSQATAALQEIVWKSHVSFQSIGPLARSVLLLKQSTGTRTFPTVDAMLYDRFEYCSLVF